MGEEGGKPLIMKNEPFFAKLNEIITKHPIDAVKALMRWKLVKEAAPSLSTDFVEALVDLNKDLYGIQVETSDWLIARVRSRVWLIARVRSRDWWP